MSTSSHPNHCKRKIPFCLARKIWTIPKKCQEDREFGKINIKCYPNSLIKQVFQKDLSITQKDLRKSKKLSNKNILPFITIFNLNNPNLYETIKSSANCLKNINVRFS